PIQVAHGDLENVHGTDVAAIDGNAAVGDERRIVSPDGTQMTVTVVAVIQSDVFIHGDFVLDQRSFPHDVGVVEETWFVAAASGVSDSVLAASLDEANPQVSAH